MSDIAKLVEGVRKGVLATRSMDQAVRQAAEKQFQDFSQSQQHYSRLVYALGIIMQDSKAALEDPVRQQAGVLLQNFIKPRNPEMRARYGELWAKQSDKFKTEVKQKLIVCMGFPGDAGAALTRSAASCLAEIAVLEIPKKLWPNFTDQMKALCQRQETNASTVSQRKNAVSLVGQVCQDLSPEHFTQKEINSLLGSVCACMTSKVSTVVGASMDAMSHSLRFIEKNLSIKAQRDHIMKEIIQHGIKSTSPEVQEKALMCIVSLYDQYYRFMGEYVTEIMKLTVGIMKVPSATDPVKTMTIEVWNTLLEVELYLEEGNHYYMRRFGIPLVPILMQNMMFRSEANAAGDDVVPERASRITLRLLASLLKSKELLQAVMEIVGRCLKADASAWNRREMGFVAMGLVMDVAEDPNVANAIKPFVMPCVKKIFECAHNAKESIHTRDSAIWALDRIFVFALHQFPNPKFAIDALKTCVQIATKAPTPKIAMRAISAIDSYFKFFKHLPQESLAKVFTAFCPKEIYAGVLQAVVSLTEKRKSQLMEDELGIKVVECAGNIIKAPHLIYDSENRATVEIIKPYYMALHPMYNNLIRALMATVKGDKVGVEFRNFMITGYCALLSECLIAFNEEGLKTAVVTASKAATETLLRCCFGIRKLRNAGAVHVESLFVASHIVLTMHDQARHLIPEIVKHAMDVIKSKSGTDETALAIGLLGEIYAFGWHNAPPKAHDTIMTVLLKLVSDASISRDAKPRIIETMVMMLTDLQTDFLKYMPKVFVVLNGAMGVKKPLGDLDEEEQDKAAFVDKLRDEIVFFFTELLRVEGADAILAHTQFQRTLGKFLLLMAQPGQATEYNTILIKTILADLHTNPATTQLAQKLKGQAIMQKFYAP